MSRQDSQFRCQTCRWFRESSDDPNRGDCMHAPPEPVNSRPVVKSNDYCASHSALAELETVAGVQRHHDLVRAVIRSGIEAYPGDLSSRIHEITMQAAEETLKESDVSPITDSILNAMT